MLAKGENTPLPGSGVRVTVSAGDGPIDVSAVLLTAGHRVRSDDDLVFFNNPARDGVRADGRTIAVEFAEVPPEISTIAVLASVDGPGTFDGVRIDARVGAGPVFASPVFTAGETAALVVELYRRGDGWKLRAVGQGWADGLAGPATDFGVTVAEAPVADPRERISLRKEAVKVSLTKKGIPGVRARVAVVLDASGSMRRLYREGVVADVVERMAAIALQIDDDASLDAWIFATTFARLPQLRVSDLESWSRDNIRMNEATAADGTRVTIGGRNNEPEVIRDVIDFYAGRPGEPVLVLFYSDGGVAKDAQIAKLLRDASDQPIFWQFVGLGDNRYGILERLDTLTGRTVDNAGFFAVDDISRISDPALYDQLLSEFPAWLRAAAQHGIPLGTNRP